VQRRSGAASKLSGSKGHLIGSGERYGCQKGSGEQVWEETSQSLGGEGEDGLDLSTERPLHKERAGNCALAGLQEGVSEGRGVGNAHADVLHQSRGQGVIKNAARGTRKSKSAVIEASGDGASRTRTKESRLKADKSDGRPGTVYFLALTVRRSVLHA